MTVIAAVNGPAVGLGHDVSGLCDIRLAAQSARFGSTFLKIGLIPGDGGSWILPQNIGASRAAEMLYTSRIIDAETALSWGLVSEVYPAEDVAANWEEISDLPEAKPLGMGFEQSAKFFALHNLKRYHRYFQRP